MIRGSLIFVFVVLAMLVDTLYGPCGHYFALLPTPEAPTVIKGACTPHGLHADGHDADPGQSWLLVRSVTSLRSLRLRIPGRPVHKNSG